MWCIVSPWHNWQRSPSSFWPGLTGDGRRAASFNTTHLPTHPPTPTLSPLSSSLSSNRRIIVLEEINYLVLCCVSLWEVGGGGVNGGWDAVISSSAPHHSLSPIQLSPYLSCSNPPHLIPLFLHSSRSSIPLSPTPPSHPSFSISSISLLKGVSASLFHKCCFGQ